MLLLLWATSKWNTVFLQISLCNDTAYANKFPIYIKWGQVKIEWGVSGGARKRDREKQINGVRDGVLERFGNSVGWEMNVGKGHMSILNKSDEKNKYNVNPIRYKLSRAVSKFSVLCAVTFILLTMRLTTLSAELPLALVLLQRHLVRLLDI